jgi:8-oxo-dGTP diphosphatase
MPSSFVLLNLNNMSVGAISRTHDFFHSRVKFRSLSPRTYSEDMEKLTALNSSGYATPVGVAADPVVFTVIDGSLALLVARRAKEPFVGVYALPGGFVGAEEASSKETVVRKLKEKTKMSPIYLEQLGFYDERERDPRGWIVSAAYVALVPAHLLPEDSDAQWVQLTALPPLPFGHGLMVADGVARLQGKLWYSNIAVGLLPPTFTIREAITVYSAISNRVYDRPSNFTRDLLYTGLVRRTGDRLSEGIGRPAELFEFISKQPAWASAYGKGTTSFSSASS